MAEPLDRIAGPRDAGAVRRDAVPMAATDRDPDPHRRDPSGEPRGSRGAGGGAAPAADRIDLHAAAQVARRLLRERVLVRTRQQLALPEGGVAHDFAEAVDDEAVAAFLGRLLGAQNQLAAQRAGDWEPRRVRACLDRALRDAVAEVLEMLAADGHDGSAGAAVVADVLTEYGRRLAVLALDIGPDPTPPAAPAPPA